MDMDIVQRLYLLTPLDGVAIVLMLIGYLVTGWVIEHPGKSGSVSTMMAEYRREWMRQFVTRDPRIFDAQIVASLRQGTAFFGSTCFIAIGGVVALLGNTEQLLSVVEEFDIAHYPVVIWQLKLALVTLFLTVGFLKFVWSNRLFGYASIVMAAVPNDPADPIAYPRAEQAAQLNIRAAANFNRGLRALYFALAALAWLLGAIALLVATVATLWMLLSREFRSRPHEILQAPPPPTQP